MGICAYVLSRGVTFFPIVVPTWCRHNGYVIVRILLMSVKLTKSAVAALAPRPTTYVMYDSILPGFGVRVTPAGVKSWIYEYRPGGGRRSNTRRITLGKVRSLAAEKARVAAQVMHHRARLGDDPAREREERRTAPTVNELASKFMAEAIRLKRKPRSADLYDFYFRTYILPELGTRRACDLTRAEVARFHRKVGAYAPVTANRLLQLLSGLYNWAMSAGELAEGSTNPARGHDRFREQARERYFDRRRVGATRRCPARGGQFLDRKLLPLFNHRSPLWGGQYRSQALL
jgi:hypothetical protein